MKIIRESLIRQLVEHGLRRRGCTAEITHVRLREGSSPSPYRLWVAFRFGTFESSIRVGGGPVDNPGPVARGIAEMITDLCDAQ